MDSAGYWWAVEVVGEAGGQPEIVVVQGWNRAEAREAARRETGKEPIPYIGKR